MSVFTIDVDTSDLKKLNAIAGKIMQAAEEAAKQGIATLAKGVVQIEKDTIDRDITYTGQTRDSVREHILPIGIEAEIGPRGINQRKIWAIYRGAPQPRWVSLSKLQDWAAQKLGDRSKGKSVQLAIAGYSPGRPAGTSEYQRLKRGTQAYPFDEETLKDPGIDTEGRAAADMIGRLIVGYAYV